MTKKTTPEFLKKLVKKRPSDCHKGNFGRVLIIGGSKGMTGAAVLSAKACLKAGAGLVTVATPQSMQPVIAASLPEAMTLPVKEKQGSIALKAVDEIVLWNREKDYEMCLIGPGLSTNSETPDFVIEIIKRLNVPAVIDADALNCIALRRSQGRLPEGVPFILTPHPGEAKRLVCFKTFSSVSMNPLPLRERIKVRGGFYSRIDLSLQISKAYGSVVVLKGHGTVIYHAEKVFINPTGGPCLAKGGSGDILAGIIAGLWAQVGVSDRFSGKTAFESACLGVYLHGLCGDMAAEKLTERCVLAGELLDFLPGAYRKINSQI